MNNHTYKENRLEKITRRWWFFLLFALIQFVPPYASKGYNFPQDWSSVTKHAMRNPLVLSYSQLYPVFKITPIVLIVLIVTFGSKVSRLFTAYVSFSYMLFAIGQSIGNSELYGVAICTTNLIMFSTVAAFWLWEAIIVQNDFSSAKIPVWRYWVVPLAILAFWYPLNLRTAGMDFNPAGLFTNIAGASFCTMTPVYIGLLTLFWPRVNIVVLRVTSLVGLIIGLYNMHLNFIVRPDTLWWNGVLHIPLLVISIYALVLSMRKVKSNVAAKSAEELY